MLPRTNEVSVIEDTVLLVIVDDFMYCFKVLLTSPIVSIIVVKSDE